MENSKKISSPLQSSIPDHQSFAPHLKRLEKCIEVIQSTATMVDVGYDFQSSVKALHVKQLNDSVKYLTELCHYLAAITAGSDSENSTHFKKSLTGPDIKLRDLFSVALPSQ